jgi:protein ImuA
MLGKAQTLEALKQRVAALETQPLLEDADAYATSAGLLATPRGAVHEVFADSLANAGSALGFALAQARRLLVPERPGLIILQLKSDAQEIGLPYGLGLRSFGLDTEAIVFIRTDTIVELLWAIEEAIACRAVGAVVADIAYPHKALDFTASRRLALRSAASAGSVFLVRYGRDREASAAKYRWRVAPALSAAPPFDDKAPGPPRWRITLEKGSLDVRRRTAADGEEYLVDWTENGLVQADDTNSRDRPVVLPAFPALSDADPAALGDRLSEAS